jgi:hypothetical protein
LTNSVFRESHPGQRAGGGSKIPALQPVDVRLSLLDVSAQCGRVHSHFAAALGLQAGQLSSHLAQLRMQGTNELGGLGATAVFHDGIIALNFELHQRFTGDQILF